MRALLFLPLFLWGCPDPDAMSLAASSDAARADQGDLPRLDLGQSQDVIVLDQGVLLDASQDAFYDAALDDGTLDSAALDDGTLDSAPLDDGALDSAALDGGALDSAPPPNDGALDSAPLDDGTPDSAALDGGTLDSAAPPPCVLVDGRCPRYRFVGGVVQTLRSRFTRGQRFAFELRLP
ncbi:hypothetical protein KKF91_16255 [Myxococcota bacterium]|nr:hypothetical protein [Myxococcota bacterium]MBU1432089.1 hypothetical protein [Myxococcota bacterium]MBU1897669.1 hypothetical protein [Myxococcota bacterium]